MKYIGVIKSNNRKALLLCAVVAFVALIGAAAAVRVLFAERSMLAMLPQPPGDAPLVAVETEGDGLPLRALKLFAESAAIPVGGTPLGELLPLFAGADRAALIVTERETGIALYGAIQLGRGEQRALQAGSLPERWASAFTMPTLTQAEPGGALQITADNLAAPLCVELDGRRAYLAEARADMEAIRGVRSGDIPGMKRKWSLERRWEGHMLLSDGGVLAAMADAGEATSPVGIEVAWRAGGEEGKRRDDVKWRIWGLERGPGKRLPKSLKTHDWSKETPLVPDHLLFSVGINMPNPGRNMANLPGWLEFFAGQLTKMGLRDSEVAALMTGPMTFSLGGRTQILWFELPGLVLDVPGRGKVAFRMLDAFWSQLFMGAEPTPLDGFTHGGTTELPFSVIAAANEQKMVVALADPAMPRNGEIGALIAREKKAIGWLFADLPMIGASLEEMSSVNALLSTDDDAPEDGDSVVRMREALGKLGKLFIVWETPTAGRAAWYE